MNVYLKKSKLVSSKEIAVSGSKSETNRLLLLQALFSNLVIENQSNSDDSLVMEKALEDASKREINVGHAGTAMRFLTAFFAIQEGREVVLTGSERMQERPIGILVDALRDLGASVQYLNKNGFPPIQITGKRLQNSEVTINSGVSSQYITALLLIGSQLENGLRLKMTGTLTSVPYIEMTLSILEEIGIKIERNGNEIVIFPCKEVKSRRISVESDWSSASYFYSLVALSEIGTEIRLKTYKKGSLQGDSVLQTLYLELGVATSFSEETIMIIKISEPKVKVLHYDFRNCPDIAQTLAVSCFSLGIEANFTGLHTLRIKETDRISALESELVKLGAKVFTSEDELRVFPSKINENIEISTYNDHRMAMSFAPLCLSVPICIKNGEVVSKSFPDFWENLKELGISFSESKDL